MNRQEDKPIIRVLIVNDSPVQQMFLEYLLKIDPQIEIVGKANNGEEAIKAVQKTKPDIVAMDYHMPKMNGFEATRKIMETNPIPIVIVSSTVNGEPALAFRALDAGAVAVLGFPPTINQTNDEETVHEFIKNIKTMASVKVVKRWPKKAIPVVGYQLPGEERRKERDIKIVAIGASTGGPILLKNILTKLAEYHFSMPILIVQHIAKGFTQGFVDWLNQTTNYTVHLAKQGETIYPGHAYIASNGYHMTLANENTIKLEPGEPVNGHCPSIDVLFRSVVKFFRQNAAGILLSGMGNDGAEALKEMRDNGALTIAQDPDTAVVLSMPQEAVKLNAASLILKPDEIAGVLCGLIRHDKGEPDG